MRILSTVSLILVAVCSLLSAEDAKLDNKTSDHLLQLEKEFEQAIILNDSQSIERIIADDWIIVDGEGHIIDKKSFLAVIQSGSLTHDAMNLEQPRVRIYGDTALITGQATSSGKYGGASFTTRELSTDVFVKFGNRWRCVLTQLTPLPGNKQ